MGTSPSAVSGIVGAGMDLINGWRDFRKESQAALGTGAPTDTYREAFNNKDPLSLPDWSHQGAAIDGKVKRLLTDPRYKASSGEQQDAYRKQIYDRYVVPAYTKSGQKVPDEKTWMEGSRTEKMLDPAVYGDNPEQDAVAQLGVHAHHGLEELSLFGSKLAKAAFLNNYGIGNLFGIPSIPTGLGLSKTLDAAAKNSTNTMFDRWRESATHAIDNDNYFFETHPTQSFLGKAAGWTGEQLATLPLYSSGIGEALKEGEFAGNLTKALGSKEAGKFVARTLNGAFLGFTGSMLSRGTITPDEEAIKEAAGFALAEGIGGVVFDRAAEWLRGVRAGEIGIRAANDAAIKQWSAKQMAMGGDPLSMASVSRAAEELRTTGEAPLPRPGEPTTGAVPPPRTTGVAPPPAAEIMHGPQLPPTGPTIREGPQPYHLGSLTPEQRRELDPTLHALVTGDKMALESIAMRHYGMDFKSLPEDLQEKVIQRRLELMEDAKHEMVMHNPEQNQKEIADSLAEVRKTNEHADNILKQLEALGVDTSKIVNDQQVEAQAINTGNKNPVSAGEKIVREIGKRGRRAAKKEAREAAKDAEAAARGKELIEEAKAAKAAQRAKMTPKQRLDAAGKKPPKAKQITPEKFASHRIDMVQRFVNPYRNNVDLRRGVLAANRANFIKALRKADGDVIKFEDPLHRMLFWYSNRNRLPEDIRGKMLSMIKQELQIRFPDAPGFTKDYIEQYADRGAMHLQSLAQSGRLGTEGNMFKSTNLFGAPTEYQTDLNTELDQQELTFLRRTLKMHPETRKFMEAIVKNLQNNRAEGLTTPQQWRDYNTAIQHVISGGMRDWFHAGAK